MPGQLAAQDRGHPRRGLEDGDREPPTHEGDRQLARPRADLEHRRAERERRGSLGVIDRAVRIRRPVPVVQRRGLVEDQAMRPTLDPGGAPRHDSIRSPARTLGSGYPRQLRGTARGRVSQALGGFLGGQVALGLGEQLVADHELADGRPQERRVEVGVELPVVASGRRRTAPGASPSSTGRAAEQAVVARRAVDEAPARPSRAASSSSGSRAPGAWRSAASRTARPPRTGRRPASRRSPRRPAARRSPGRRSRGAAGGPSVEVAPLGRILARRLARERGARPRSGRADGGSTRPSPRRGSRTPGPSGSRAPSSAVCVGPEVDDRADVRGRHPAERQVMARREAEDAARAALALGAQQARPRTASSGRPAAAPRSRCRTRTSSS